MNYERRRLLFLLLTLVSSLLLIAVGWRLLQQDFELEQQQAYARREAAADSSAIAVEQAVAATEEKLRDPEAMRFLATTPDSISVAIGDGQFEALPHGRLLYYPIALAGESAPGAIFEDGEALEYQRQNPAAAAKWFGQLARNAPAPVRAGALIRAARNLRKSGQDEAALAVYSEAARLATTAIGEVPTELFARRERCDLLDKLRSAELKKEALELRELLLEGRWRLTHSVFAFHFQAASRWAGAGEPPANHRLALSDAVAGIVQPLNAIDARSTMTAGGVKFTVLSQVVGSRTHVLVAGPAYAEQEWKPRIGPMVIRDPRAARPRGGQYP